MHTFDALAGGWDATCGASGDPQVLRLSAFRRVRRLPGPAAPPAHLVTYRCACGDEHGALMSSAELDWLPVAATFGAHYDLMTGRMGRDPDAGPGLWARSMQRGHWPVTLRCEHHAGPVPAWPSCLRALEPDEEGAARWYLVHYVCPLCERRGSEVMRREALELVPRAA
ncbi:hypothetical protein [Patulibacter sp. SYSU D01012]|uniref:hypothetical protein n=1 Tax=Patulibacter sp. SYSU D01012 TaxID=2817381 RepID=UPI001B30C2A7|nr:hypothetical protein [Patulibacter sp. SYSU D01012]